MWYRDYRCKYWTMFKDYENNIQYGIDESKRWYSGEIVHKKVNSEYLASDEEIEKALRKEAKRRGFVEGVKFLGCEGHQKDEELVIDKIKFNTEFKGLHCGNSWIFLFGQWGTVVNQAWGAYLEEIVRELEGCFNTTREEVSKGTYQFFGDNMFCSNDGGYIMGFDPYKKEEVFYYYNSKQHGANFYELVKEVETKVNDSWKTFVIYKQLGSGLEFSREKEEFLSKFKQVYV